MIIDFVVLTFLVPGRDEERETRSAAEFDKDEREKHTSVWEQGT